MHSYELHEKGISFLYKYVTLWKFTASCYLPILRAYTFLSVIVFKRELAKSTRFDIFTLILL